MSLSYLLFAGKYSIMTSYFSNAFLYFFLPASILGFLIMPKRAKKYFLLAASLIYFWLVSGKLIIYLLLSILAVHYFGLWLDRIQKKQSEAVKAAEKEERKQIKKGFQKKSRLVLGFAAFLHIGLLLVLKYSPFFTENLNAVLAALNVSTRLEIPSYLMPIGISFYSLQAVSYLFDVYRGTTKADDNIFRLGLFMSFFPQIVEGPICRYNQTAEKLWNVTQIDYHRFLLGLQRILFGYMKKLVVADRLNPFVNEAFDHYANYDGPMLALGALLYTVQLYMDFSGTMDAVVGIGIIFGVEMPENFRRPFFSKTISEFWQRWHITLGTWFKDYIFYPVTMSKPMKKLTSSACKKLGNHFGPLLAGSIALFCVWLSNGLWHGAGWNYIFFGMYHFVLILCGSLIAPAVTAFNQKLHLNPESFVYRAFRILRTSLLVVIGEMFFRADSVKKGLFMFKKLLTDHTWQPVNTAVSKLVRVDNKDLLVVLVAVIIVFIVGLLNEKGIIVRESLSKKNVLVRWIIIYALVMFIFVFGAYGPDYIPVDPMYAGF